MIPYIDDGVSVAPLTGPDYSAASVSSASYPLFCLLVPKHSQVQDIITSTAQPIGAYQMDTRRKFKRLAAKWRRETMHFSSVADMSMNEAYQQIIGMSWAAVPLIMEELAGTPDHWFWALKAITGKDPVSPSRKGNLNAMADAWLNWWQNHISN